MKRCPHRRTIVASTGGYHYSYSAGVWDDIKEYVICLDCFKVIERGWWSWKYRVMRYYNVPPAKAEEVPF
ncbi:MULTISPECIES: hypothetical protein [Anaerolinea]|uniref:Uncharacterized protein n=1 Tax=Anaerolinea thermophila (strain DSM 14523 / JCM 11388 / NBRC 100420 / UNI-1) TaxID=926569 RepID=E8MYS9_ANATU|nr:MULTISPECIES: hypothetical protein [Anaerolinea]BAJ64415.1 hypothetical protein ANT_23890 [Anaerolinea thermophila UNI-1]GAP07453.1 hypothetical protein ATHL_02336 [Anaerolinea thermolimosa]